jgi:DNA-binding GntR family transcriptional regulator
MGKAPPRDLSMEAYLRIKEKIREGKLRPGARITETELSDELKMSRTPVREAIGRLESDGLIVHEARIGLTVTRPDYQLVMELYTMREALEGTALRLAAQHASDAEVEALCELVAREPGVIKDAKTLSSLNVKFHGLIALAAHNRYLVKSLDTMSATLSLLPTMLGNHERAAAAHEEHVAMVDALRQRDPKAAEEAARAHIRSARRSRLELYMQFD